ncbi:MAG: hypothetical protein L3K15_08390 [Thermoplasmata archaeon]|nr:hypothetical protein [Thermoplasmata archaeon]
MTEPRSGRGLLIALQALLLILFFLAFPGLGIETRPYSSYAAWAGPVFLLLTLLLFGAGIAAVALVHRRPSVASMAAIVDGVIAVIIVALDTSHVGGLPPPPGPLVLGVVSALVGLALIVAAGRYRAKLSRAAPAPPPVGA